MLAGRADDIARAAEVGHGERFPVSGADPASCRITIPNLIAAQARRFGDREFVVDGDLSLTFAHFEAQMTDVARAAIALGMRPGDRVSVWAGNSARWLVAAMGCTAAGAVLVPMNSRYKGTEAAGVIERVRPSVLFTTRHFLDIDYPAMLRAGGAEPGTRIVVMDGQGEHGDLSWEQFLAAGHAVPVEQAVAVRQAASPDDVSDIILTSGTTGTPKGVMTSHYQNVLAWIRYIEHIGLRDGERMNATLPFFHNFGLKEGFLDAVIVGGACIVEPVFSAAGLARLIESARITYLGGTPTIYTALLDRTEALDADFSSLWGVNIAGAIIPPELVKRASEELAEHICIGYGLSELAGGISLTPKGASLQRQTHYCGSLVGGVTVRIVDESGQDLPPGEPGEIWASSECIMAGYMDDADATTAAIDADGWLHTGDVGVIDDEKYIRIVDRKKDMFIVGGFNAYPAEIETLLLHDPAIAQVAVVGMPDARMGEVAAAFVVPAQPGLTSEQVIAWARENMANYKVPRHVHIVAALPMNSSMKVVKNDLRKLLSTPATA